MENNSSPTGTRAKSAIRALDVLEALAPEPKGLSFTDLLRVIKVPKSSLHELLAVLTDRGFVEVDGTSRRYTLGIRAWESGQAYLRQHELVTMTRPVMESIVRDLNETVQLAVLDGIENVYLAKVDCSHPLRLQSQVGRRLYAHATGLGKVLLAHLPDDECRERFKGLLLPRFTPTTIIEQPLLFRRLAEVRERGFAMDNQEYDMGLRCIAVPIRDHLDRVSAALSVSIPLMRASREQCAQALMSLARGSLDVSRRLGCMHDDPKLLALLTISGARAALLREEALEALQEIPQEA